NDNRTNKKRRDFSRLAFAFLLPIRAQIAANSVANLLKTAAIEAIPTPEACVQNNVYKRKGVTA
ncbi:hypothetical protein, partial [Desulfovibrio piger]|uniref:hypothetical protein n=1 Tax=Desulfovibrio piger TaxID=901 RepID=UPI001DC4F79E